MITKADVQKMLLEGQQMQGIVYKRSLNPRFTPAQILKSFEDILANKPNGYWLLRESRVDGKISVTYTKDDKISNARFAFLEGKWTIDNNNEVHEFTMMDRERIGSQCQELMRILERMGFTLDHLVLPNEHQRSERSIYNQYITVVEKDFVYDNPIEALDIAINKLKLLSPDDGDFRNIVLDINNASRPLDELFTTWLEKNGMEYGLVCPVSLCLMKKPYIISESGRAFEAETLFDENNKFRFTHCPMTREAIILRPYRVEGYRSKLGRCLTQFEQLVNLTKITHEQLLCGAPSSDSSSSSASSSSSGFSSMQQFSFFLPGVSPSDVVFKTEASLFDTTNQPD